jgi:hypothetical protein
MTPEHDKILKYVETAPQPIKDVWNAAIEAAAKEMEAGNCYGYDVDKIRRLKK